MNGCCCMRPFAPGVCQTLRQLTAHLLRLARIEVLPRRRTQQPFIEQHFATLPKGLPCKELAQAALHIIFLMPALLGVIEDHVTVVAVHQQHFQGVQRRRCVHMRQPVDRNGVGRLVGECAGQRRVHCHLLLFGGMLINGSRAWRAPTPARWRRLTAMRQG